MKARATLTGTLCRGSLILDAFAEALLRDLPDGLVLVTVGPLFSARSGQANRFYWGVVIPTLAEHWGYTKDELHDALKWKFLRVDNPDFPMPTVRSTATLTTEEFQEYVNQVRRLGEEDGCVVLDREDASL